MVFATPSHAALSGYESVVLGQDPYSFHRFNEAEGATAVDSSGNLRDGTYVGSPTFGIPGAGGEGTDNAVGFNGSNQYMEIADAADLGEKLANVTFEAVFSTTATDRATLFGTWNTGFSMTANFTLNDEGDDVHRLFIRNGRGQTLIGIFENGDLTNGDFHHLMLTVDMSQERADRIRLYINGQEDEITVSSQTAVWLGDDMDDLELVEFGFPLAVGARNVRGNLDRHFNGVIDEFAIYDDTLTEDAAAAHFAAISSLAADPPRITEFSYDPADGSAEITLEGIPDTPYTLFDAADLDFSNPDREPLLLTGATVGTLFQDEIFITDESGLATVQFNLGTGLANFVRAEELGVITLASFDFEADGQGFIPSGDWEWGSPNSDNGLGGGQVVGGNQGSTGAWATVLGDGGPAINGGIDPGAESVLISPDINLSGISGASLEFAAAVDALPEDTLEILVFDAADTSSPLGTIDPFPGGLPANAAWQNLGPFALPEGAEDKTIYLEFHFVGTDSEYLGFYLDDVTITL